MTTPVEKNEQRNCRMKKSNIDCLRTLVRSRILPSPTQVVHSPVRIGKRLGKHILLHTFTSEPLPAAGNNKHPSSAPHDVRINVGQKSIAWTLPSPICVLYRN